MLRIKQSNHNYTSNNYTHSISENDYIALQFMVKELLRYIIERKRVHVIKDKVYLILNVIKNFK